ncbi:hypothetical protein MALU111345_18820 [Marinicrinis lubricantis]
MYSYRSLQPGDPNTKGLLFYKKHGYHPIDMIKSKFVCKFPQLDGAT